MSLVNRGKWLISPANINEANKETKIYVCVIVPFTTISDLFTCKFKIMYLIHDIQLILITDALVVKLQNKNKHKINIVEFIDS